MIQWETEMDFMGVEPKGAKTRLPVFGLVEIERKRVRDDRRAEGSRIEWRIYVGRTDFPVAEADDLESAKARAEAHIREQMQQILAAIN